MTGLTSLPPAHPTVDETSLLTAAQEGDGEAFGELCLLVEARLFRQAMALCGQPTTAEELTQDTLVAAWESLARFNGECQFFTWLGAILLHRHQRHLRSRRSWRRWFSAAVDGGQGQLGEVSDTAAGPDQSLTARERNTEMRRCLEDLSVKHREVVFLRFYGDNSLEEIAVALKCSVGTVKSRLFHALEHLRKMRNLPADFERGG